MLDHPSNEVEVGSSLCEPSYQFRTCLCFFRRLGWTSYLSDRLLPIGADSVWVIASSADRGQSLLYFLGDCPFCRRRSVFALFHAIAPSTDRGRSLLCFGRLPLRPTEVGLCFVSDDCPFGRPRSVFALFRAIAPSADRGRSLLWRLVAEALSVNFSISLIIFP